MSVVNFLKEENMTTGSKFLMALITIAALAGCGSSGGGGGGDSLSITAINSAFPNLNENDLTVTARYAAKWYDYSAQPEAVDSFKSSLLEKKFVVGAKLECEDYENFYRQDGIMLACAETDTFDDIDIALGSTDGSYAPTDADLNNVFGAVPGKLYYVERGLQVAADLNAESAMLSYAAALQRSGFECGSYYCYKTSGSFEYGVAYENEPAGRFTMYWYIVEY
jgi:hypothetical protein